MRWAADVVPINEYHATPGALFDVDERHGRRFAKKVLHGTTREERACDRMDGQLHEA